MRKPRPSSARAGKATSAIFTTASSGGNFPKWALKVQIIPEADAAKVPYHPFDLTKIWPHKDYPLIEVGVLELNRNPENFFAEVEQSAFNPANVVPGIGFSPDRMLQGRLFAYGDAQRYRLGVNHHLIPVNAPRCPVHSYPRDGAMRVDGNFGSTLGYQPNDQSEWAEPLAYAEPPLSLAGAADHWNHREDHDYYSQPREIQMRHIAHCLKADPGYGDGVAVALGITLSNLPG